jgi:Fe-S cluster assembly protein SufD
VLIEPGVQVDVPLHIVHVSAPGAGVTIAHPRTVLRAGRDSQMHVIETYVGLGGPSITNASTRLVVGDGASLTYHRIEAEPTDSIHVGRAAIDLGAESTVRASSIMSGGDIARTAIDATFGGDGGSLDLTGLYLPQGHQRHETMVRVDHGASRCTSNQRFKGVVDGHGRGSFSGHVVVRPGTVGTDANQSNPNLVLSPTAQADTRPWLEIFADDVRCAHGASVGRLDHDAVFYLRSRGIPLAESRAMLVAAFSAEIIDAIGMPSLRDWVAAAVARGASEAAS